MFLQEDTRDKGRAGLLFDLHNGCPNSGEAVQSNMALGQRRINRGGMGK